MATARGRRSTKTINYKELDEGNELVDSDAESDGDEWGKNDVNISQQQKRRRIDKYGNGEEDEVSFVIDVDDDDVDDDSVGNHQAMGLDDDDDDYTESSTKAKRNPTKGKGKQKRTGRSRNSNVSLTVTAKGVSATGARDGQDDKGTDGSAQTTDIRSLCIKADHSVRPIWVVADAISGDIRIFLETNSPFFQQAYDFLIMIAEPVSRPEHIHEYKLTAASLYAAASIGLETDTIVEFLNRLCKTEIQREILEVIRRGTGTYGKVRLAVKHNRYFVESSDVDALQTLLRDTVIRNARVVPEASETGSNGTAATSLERSQGKISSVVIEGGTAHQKLHATSTGASGEDVSDALLAAAAAAMEGKDPDAVLPEDLQDFYDQVDADDSDDEAFDVVSFEIKPEELENVQSRCIAIEYPLIAEYDFRNDKEIRNVPMAIKPTTVLRPYQEKALRKMFGRGRSRSGVIVLPCGAGKTLTGVAAACTIKKRTLVLCKTEIAVEQWVTEFERWANVPPGIVTRFSSHKKEVPAEDGIIVCTYTLLGFRGKRAYDSQQIVEFIRSRKWGLMILDEVQTAPADTFRTILSMCPCHCKLGLTATLLREDGRIKDLLFLLGPKLYEANWMTLAKDGYIANVKCAEVRVPMTKAFYREYLSDHTEKGIKPTRVEGLRRLLRVMNPNKFQALEYLVRVHERRGDKIIVFCDRKFALETFSSKLQCPLIYGATSAQDRLSIINNFKAVPPKFRTLFCSTIADEAIDLPGANVLIQVDYHGMSERQEAQRLGRILRAKKNSIPGEINAFFYTIVSEDTKEMSQNAKRQTFLINQGYSYKVIKDMPGFTVEGAHNPFGYSTPSEQQNLLAAVIGYNVDDDQDQEDREDQDDNAESAMSERQSGVVMFGGRGGDTAGGFVRRSGTMAALSGADGIVYQQQTVKQQQRKQHKGKQRQKR